MFACVSRKFSNQKICTRIVNYTKRNTCLSSPLLDLRLFATIYRSREGKLRLKFFIFLSVAFILYIADIIRCKQLSSEFPPSMWWETYTYIHVWQYVVIIQILTYEIICAYSCTHENQNEPNHQMKLPARIISKQLTGSHWRICSQRLGTQIVPAQPMLTCPLGIEWYSADFRWLAIFRSRYIAVKWWIIRKNKIKTSMKKFRQNL